MNLRARMLLIVSLALIVAGGVTVRGCGGRAATSPVNGSKALQHAGAICEKSPRPPGSPALVDVGNYIKGQLADMGLKPQEQVFVHPQDRDPRLKLPFRNIWVEIPTKNQEPKTAPILVIGSHYDSKLCMGHPNQQHNFEFIGAVDGAGSSGLLIELARVLKERNNVPNIWLVWFDGEESLDFKWNDERALFGSRHFVKKMAQDKERFPGGLSKRMRVLVLLDLVGASDYKIDRDLASNPELIEIFAEAGRQLGESSRMFKTESSMVDDHKPFIVQQVKCIDLIDLHYRGPDDDGKPPHPDFAAWWHTQHDTFDKLSAEGLQFAGDLVWAALPMIEQRFYADKR